MKKFILTAFLAVITGVVTVFAQEPAAFYHYEDPLIQVLKYDTVITNKAYTSYYSNHYSNPVVVVYHLYHGGGDCSRAGFEFKNDIKSLTTAHNSDYKAGGYDKGHMANAEDFAYDCTLDELTFRYYNCVPQTPELNRGPWKHFETVIRNLSQGDHLIILCYNEFDGAKMKNVYIPSRCFKIVYDEMSKEIVYAFCYTNTATPFFTDIRKHLDEYNYLLKLMK
jgi:DNA/RNA endonuclease G (NUC1)